MIRFWLTFIVIILAVPLIPFALFGELPGESWVEHPNPTYVFIVGASLLCSDIFLPIPSSVIALFMATKLGFIAGTAAIMTGLTLGSLIGYYVGRRLGYPFMNKVISNRNRKVIESLSARFSGQFMLAMLRSVPVFAEASVLAAGVMRLRPIDTVVTLTVSNFCLSVLYSYAAFLNEELSSPIILLIGSIVVPCFCVTLIYLLSRISTTRNMKRTMLTRDSQGQ